MKSVSEIFAASHLIPLHKKVEHECRRSILFLLPYSCVHYVSQIFVKNRILYVCVNHEGVIFDVDYKLKSVKGAILQTISHLGCTSMEFDKIRVYFKEAPLKPTIKTIWTEKERSDGKFTNMLQNETLRNIIEDIRGIICKTQ
jgi:hypothetical protein